MDTATNSYNKLKRKIKFIKNNIEGNLQEEKIEEYKKKFKEAFENDMNTSTMLTILFDVIKSDLNNKTKMFLIEDFDKVLSLDLTKEEKIDENLLNYINKKIEERNKAKKEKNYKLADDIRNELQEKNIIIKDTKEGTTFEIK